MVKWSGIVYVNKLLYDRSLEGLGYSVFDNRLQSVFSRFEELSHPVYWGYKFLCCPHIGVLTKTDKYGSK
jgi:hypothetical protein